MAAPDTMCTAKSVGLSVDINPYEPHLVAGTMAHMIGHNIGMGHDDGRKFCPKKYQKRFEINQDFLIFQGDECHCGDWHGCIMSQSIMGLDNVQPYKFSECSLSDYIDSLRIGHGICLFNRPNQVRKFDDPILCKRIEELDNRYAIYTGHYVPVIEMSKGFAL